MRNIREIKQDSLTNGAAIFSGYDTTETFISRVIYPPKPIRKALYSCGKLFLVDSIMSLYEKSDNYGVVLISGETTEFYLVNDTIREMVDKITIMRNKKQKKGGQSSQRFQRIRLNQINEYVELITNKIIHNYVIKDDGIKLNIMGLIIGGIGPVKDSVVKSIKDSAYNIPICKVFKIDKMDVKSVITKASDILQGVDVLKELSILEKVNDGIKNEETINNFVFGEKDVKNHLENFMLKEVIAHESVSIDIKYKCIIHKITSLTHEGEMFLKNYQGIVGIKWY